MKPGWEVRRLGEVATIVMGQAPPSSECNKDGRGTPFVKAGEFTADRPLVREWTTRPLKLAKATDVLVCVVGATCGKISLGADCAIGRSVAAVRPRHGAITQEWLFHFLSGKVALLRAGSLGAAQTVITQEMIADQKLMLPPLAEQRRIVEVLDEAFAGLATATANAEQTLAGARELFVTGLNSRFSSLGAEPVSLERLVAPDTPITYGVVKPGPPGNIPFVRGGDIVSGEIDISNLRTITDDVSRQYRRTMLRGGEVLMCLVGVPGATAVAQAELAGANIARQVGLIRLQHEIDPEYVSLYLRSTHGQAVLRRHTGGSVQQVINLGDLRTVQIPLPRADEQANIVTEMDELASDVTTVVNNTQQKLTLLAELKASLLQRAFAGELV